MPGPVSPSIARYVDGTGTCSRWSAAHTPRWMAEEEGRDFHSGAIAQLIGWLAAVLLLVGAGCGKEGPANQVVVGGAVGFDQKAAGRSNAPIPKARASVVCGATGPVFGAELATVEPQNARVVREWGEIVPGKQMYVAGTIREMGFSRGDLQFTHPYDRD